MTNQTAAEMVSEKLQRFRNGDAEEVFFTLLEADDAIVPELKSAFSVESDAECRALIVEVLWQRRNPAIIPFLAEGLNDSESQVWQQALDGLVALASADSLAALHAARVRKFSRQDETDEFRSWIDEAIAQIENCMQKSI